MSQDSAIYLVPLSLREANDFLAKYGRSYRPMRGCKFCVGCALDGKLAGAVIAGRCREDGQTVQIDRVYATGGRTAYGMLYGGRRGRPKPWATGGSSPFCQRAGRIPPCEQRAGSAWSLRTAAGSRRPTNGG